MPHVRKSKLIEQRLEAHAHLLVSDAEAHAGSWRSSLGKPDGRLHVDLGCGKGLWISRAATLLPDAAFVGIDNERMCASFAVEKLACEGADNARIVLDEARNIGALFAPGEIDVIHLNFPTPFPRKKEAHRRVTAAERLMEYRRVLRPSGMLHLKTDSQPLFDFTVEELDRAGYTIVSMTRDLHGDRAAGAIGVLSPAPNEEHSRDAALRQTGARAAGSGSAQHGHPFGSFSQEDFALSAYEEKLTAKGARIMALCALPGDEPERFEQAKPVGLAQYLPADLESIDYVPHGMEDTVNNMRNRKRNAAKRAKRHSF